ncbi:MAG: putative O-methyltransferase YrrM [Porticoccus sp.]|uniref:class I SAM-dependent methyltransferase n=1 Tax=Porticoccus sp. TaxID=2024853 RepID=UPI0039E3A60C
MKKALKAFAKRFSTPIDAVLSVLIVPVAYLLLAYRRWGSARLPLTTGRLKRIGIFPLRNHYYEPLFDDSLLLEPLDNPRYLPGIDLNEAGQLAFIRGLGFTNELITLDLAVKKESIAPFFIDNKTFNAGDADFLYQILRFLKPKKLVEIGSGNSTKMARSAMLKNRAETAVDYRHICIEPYEQPWLDSLESIEVIRQRVENVGLDLVAELQAGDLLFIDSSHVIRPQGDVLTLYLDILPRLKPGVYVHVHDIFTPRDYLKDWVVDDVRLWNEQYLLEALLSNSRRYEVVAALNFLKHDHYQSLAKVCPYLKPDSEPASFYFRVVNEQ